MRHVLIYVTFSGKNTAKFLRTLSRFFGIWQVPINKLLDAFSSSRDFRRKLVDTQVFRTTSHLYRHLNCPSNHGKEEKALWRE